jgi:serine/threonine protein kinase
MRAGMSRPPREAAKLRVAPGDVIADKYVVETVLGSGAMGFVVAARHKLIGQRVAIKLINSAYLDDSDALERFEREAHALVAVQSENVVRVLDYGTLPDGSPYLVMELLHGRDLLAELRARGTLPLGEAAEIVVQACEGLAAVHAQGIVHRDVKPANLFLTTRSSGRLLVKIVDFGISKTRPATEEELSLTRGSIGSPHYTSPEQLRSARAVDARSDVWSLGVTLFRTLTGEQPFAGASMGTLMAAVMTEDPRPLRDLRPDLPAEIGEIIVRCLAKNVEERYASVSELADALTPFAVSPRARAPGAPADRVSGSSHPALEQESTAKARASAASVHGMNATAERRRRVTLVLAIGVPFVLVVAALSLVLRRAPPVVPAPAGSSVAAATSGLTVITDAPPPKTSNRQAAAEYEAALQAVRDASLANASDRFTRAAALDPTMAAAELRSAIYGSWLSGAETRKHGRAAMALRSSLSDRDGELLTALEPLYVSPHPDTAEAERRFKALVAARPNDTEILLVSAMVLFNRESPVELAALSERMLAIDPGFAAAAWVAALVSDEGELSMRAINRCLAIAPSAASCLRVRATVEETNGDCAALETDAQRMVAMEGSGRRAYEFLSLALFARGRPLDSVREALRLKWNASAEGARAALQATDEAKLALATGDFVTAQRKAEDLDALAEKTDSEAVRRGAVLLEIELHTELGEVGAAAQVADAYLKRMSAWPASDAIEDDPRPRLYAAAARGGLRRPDEVSAARREWIASWGEFIEPLDRARIWLEGYAAPAATPAEAQEALASLPFYEPLPNLMLGGWTAPLKAKIFALAGHPAEALPDLRAVTTSCRMLRDPGESVRAQLWLGEALEKTHDMEGACDAYRKVVDRWGGEKRSVTAAAARARINALGCAPR